MRTLVCREFVVDVPLAAAWDHLARVEEWPRWAPHITRVDLTLPGPLTPASQSVLHLRPGMTSIFRVTEFRTFHAWRCSGSWTLLETSLGVSWSPPDPRSRPPLSSCPRT